MLKRLPILLAASLLVPAYSKDFGIQGATFEIKEQSLLKTIYAKLKNLESTNKLVRHQKEIQEKVKTSIENPKPIPGITKAISYSSRTYDPSIIIDEDIKDHKGNYIARKGTHVNPLDYHSFGKPLLLIQGEDDAQVQWALKQDTKDTSVADTCVSDTGIAHTRVTDTRVVIVLVSGKPLQLARIHNKIFYFDQGAVLSKKFSIKTVPARISQKGKILLIEEFRLGEEISR